MTAKPQPSPDRICSHVTGAGLLHATAVLAMLRTGPTIAVAMIKLPLTFNVNEVCGCGSVDCRADVLHAAYAVALDAYAVDGSAAADLAVDLCWEAYRVHESACRERKAQ